jgi:hypothetical protein
MAKEFRSIIKYIVYYIFNKLDYVFKIIIIFFSFKMSGD